jgi:pimeloyl-ACP methyl ester carboxylesterase
MAATDAPAPELPLARQDPVERWFPSRGARCHARWWRAESDALTTDAGRPCIVLGHGFGATADSGLEPYARAFAAAGIDALLFDYPGFGRSEGAPRQVVTFRGHRRDFRAAIALARTLEGVDRDRIALFGSSYSGGHVLAAAAQDGRIAAVVSQCPAVDGRAALLNVVRRDGVGQVLRLTAAGLADAAGAALRRPPRTIPAVGAPGQLAVMTTPDAFAGMTEIAGPTWENRIAARELLVLALNRPITAVPDVACPILLCNCDEDAVCPPEATRATAASAPGRAELRSFPIGHFDIYRSPWFERAAADQVAFLQRVLARS